MSRVYHEPSTLNEWTLEMNLNHEILSMFNDFFTGNYPYYLRRVFFDLPLVSPLNPFRKKGFVYKLTPREEGSGGGWDGKIILPKSLGRENRIIFIQYKRGYHSNGNNEPRSLFSLANSNPNIHVEFTFNSDNNKNQHQYLKNLVDELEGNGNSKQIVMYGFPRITTKEQFEELGGSLLLYTTFLTIAQMDEEAQNAGVNLYDSEEHRFRTCYNDVNKREICSDPFKLEYHDQTIDVLFEIMAYKIATFWNNSLDKTRYKDRIKDELKLVVADYLKINPFERDSNLFYFQELYENGYLNHFKNIENERNELEKRLFFSNSDHEPFQNTRSITYERLSKFIDSFENRIINLDSEIPMNYTQSINKEFRLNLNDWKTNATLSYQII